MYQLIDFITDEPIKRVTKMGEPPPVAEFPDREAARRYAESIGYEMILEDRFLRNQKPTYVKIIEVET